MATKIIDNNGIVSFDSISSEEDFKLRPRISINPPPANGRCECCGRHISELEPFNSSGDSFLDDFKGALLVKMFRPMGPYDEESERAWNEAEKHLDDVNPKDEHPLERVFIKCVNEKGEIFYFSGKASCKLASSWECCDCAILDRAEYFEKLREYHLKQ